MHTLVSRIEKAAQSAGAITFMVGGAKDQVPWSQMLSEALDLAAVLQSKGLRRGGHVALLGPTSRALVTAMQATWFAGAALIVLPLPMRLSSIEEFTRQTRARILQADTDILLVDTDLAPFIEPDPADPPTFVLQELVVASKNPPPFVRPAVDPDDLAILQFTSGSTSEPKGVMLPHRVICANHDAIFEVLRLGPGDVGVSWLPLYHDMGLVGMLLLTMTSGVDLVLGAPQDFLADPGKWLEWLSEYGGTATAGPNFSWVLATRSLRTRKDTLDLSRLRIGLNGAEPVDPSTMRDLIEAGARHGLRPDAIFPAFGMAELAIGGTFPQVGDGLRTDWIDGSLLERERFAAPADPASKDARELVKLGKILAGMEMRVVEPGTARVLDEREVGELQIRGTSLTPGYYRNSEATDALLVGGWLHTGDLAYLVDGDLVVCGRIKDVIIVGGRNVYPQDIERAVGEVEGIRKGNVIAFGIAGRAGKESIVVVAESKAEADDVDKVRSDVAAAVRLAVGLPVREVVLVASATLPKTSSGKLQRVLCRQRYLAGELNFVNVG